jgi:hypothetical protein
VLISYPRVLRCVDNIHNSGSPDEELAQSVTQVTLGFKGTADPVANIQAFTNFYGADSANGWTKTVCDSESICIPLLEPQLK